MAISFVGSLLPVGANNGGNVTLSLTGLGLQQGDVVIVGHALSNTSDIAMALGSTGWSPIEQTYANGSTYDTNLAGWYKAMGATPDTSVVLNGAGGSAFGTIGGAHAFRGVDPNNPLDIAAVNAADTGTSVPNPGSIAPATAGAWPVVIGAGSAAAGAAYTAPTGLSTGTNHFRSLNHAETNDIAIGIGFKSDWSSGAFDCPAFGGGNVNAANSWAAIAFALRPSTAQTHQGAFAASGAGTFSASGSRRLNAALAVAGSGSVSVVGRLLAAARAALNGVGSFAASAARQTAAAFSSVGSGTASLWGRMTANSSVTAQGAGQFSASGQVEGVSGPCRMAKASPKIRIGV